MSDAAVGEDDTTDTAFNSAECGFDLDHHAARRCRQGRFRGRGIDLGDQ
jgi:hypothetical protein